VCTADGTALVESHIWPDGKEIDGKYRVLAKIGQDVVCTVYKALHLKSQQFRTLKMMSWELACDPAFVQLFEQDALLRKKLRHENVSRVEEISEAEDGRPFIVMEYVAGQSLKKYIEQDAPFAPLRVCAIAKQVAAGLDAAHALGMVHRDVKPESIFLLDGQGSEKIKLLGLGIAKLQEALLGDRFRTSPEAVIGTLQYLSPEQALGQLGSELDGRADLYSLGVIMYQMLTRELPFKATHASDWMMAHIQGTPTPIRVAYANLGIPDVLTDLVMQCLKKNRELRPPSARQLIRDLELVEKEIDRIEKDKLTAPKGPGHRKSSPGWKFWKS
jgi:serine/threonine-protein kinase